MSRPDPKVSDFARPPRALTFAEAIYPFEVDGIGRASLCVPLPELQGQAEFSRRWLIDARAATSRTHGTLEQVIGAGQTGALVWRIVPERRGWTAGALLRRARSTDAGIAPDALKSLGASLAEAITGLHAAGQAHGQISVETTEIDADGGVLLRGLPVEPKHHGARLSALRAMIPPELLAPEQLLYDNCDARTDVYQIALVLLTLATGGNPFVRRDRGQTVGAVCQGGDRLPTLGRLPEALRDVLSAALRADPEERPPLAELRRELEGAAPPPSERTGHLSALVRQLSAGRPPPAPMTAAAELEEMGARLAELARRPGAPALEAPVASPPRSRRALALAAVAIVAFAAGVGLPRLLEPPAPRVGAPPSPPPALPTPSATPTLAPIHADPAPTAVAATRAEPPSTRLSATVPDRPTATAGAVPRASDPRSTAQRSSATPESSPTAPPPVEAPTAAPPTSAAPAAPAGHALVSLSVAGDGSRFALRGETTGNIRPLGYMVEDTDGGRYVVRLPGATNAAGFSALPVSTGAVARITVAQDGEGVTITVHPGPDGLGHPVLQRRSGGFDLRLE